MLLGRLFVGFLPFNSVSKNILYEEYTHIKKKKIFQQWINMDNWLKVDTVIGVSGHTIRYKGREVVVVSFKIKIENVKYSKHRDLFENLIKKLLTCLLNSFYQP